MDLIRENKSVILKNWEEEVRAKIPSAAEQLSRMALYNSLPDFLDLLATICHRTEATSEELSEVKEELIGKVHGQHRANASYPIDQMILEYYILMDIIVNLYKKNNKLDLATYEVINSSFQKAVQVSASQFSKSLVDAQEGFVLALVHDLRSPLTALKLQIDMLKHASGTRIAVLTERMNRSCGRLSKMIEDLLNTLSATHEKIYINTVECDISEIIHTVIRDFRDRADAQIIFEGSPCKGEWNPTAFERVFDNLLSNAYKYGDITRPIQVRLEQDPHMVNIRVHNFGEPIPKEELINIFNKFKRSEKAQLRKGWGIGLSLVKSVVEAHRGSVLVNSDQGGTTFILELPRFKPDHIEKSSSSIHAPVIKH